MRSTASAPSRTPDSRVHAVNAIGLRRTTTIPGPPRGASHLPRSALRESASHRGPRPPRLWAASPRVLVAYDDPTTMSTIGRALQGAGYQVASIPLGAHVADRLTRGKSARPTSNPLELLVLDASRQPWVALALLEALRSVDRALPVVVIADSDPATRQEATRLCAEAVLDSPPDPVAIRLIAENLAPLTPDQDVEALDVSRL